MMKTSYNISFNVTLNVTQSIVHMPCNQKLKASGRLYMYASGNKRPCKLCDAMAQT